MSNEAVVAVDTVPSSGVPLNSKAGWDRVDCPPIDDRCCSVPRGVQTPHRERVRPLSELLERHVVIARHLRQPVEPADEERRDRSSTRTGTKHRRSTCDRSGPFAMRTLGAPKSIVHVNRVTPRLPSASDAVTRTVWRPLASPDAENVPSVQSDLLDPSSWQWIVPCTSPAGTNRSLASCEEVMSAGPLASRNVGPVRSTRKTQPAGERSTSWLPVAARAPRSSTSRRPGRDRRAVPEHGLPRCVRPERGGQPAARTRRSTAGDENEKLASPLICAAGGCAPIETGGRSRRS